MVCPNPHRSWILRIHLDTCSIFLWAFANWWWCGMDGQQQKHWLPYDRFCAVDQWVVDDAAREIHAATEGSVFSA
jgi:hypothetical protein